MTDSSITAPDSPRVLSAAPLEERPLISTKEGSDSTEVITVFVGLTNGQTYCLRVNPLKEDIRTLKTRLYTLMQSDGEMTEDITDATTSKTDALDNTVWVWNNQVLSKEDVTLSDYGVNSTPINIHVVLCGKNASSENSMVLLPALALLYVIARMYYAEPSLSAWIVPLLLPLLLVFSDK